MTLVDELTPDQLLLRIRHIRTAADLAGIAESWNRLAGDVPFRRWEWCEAWWRNYAGPEDQLCVLAVVDQEGQLIGLAPWYLTHCRWQGRVLRFLGSGETCADYLTVMAAPGLEDAVAAHIAEWLSETSGHDWDLLHWDAVVPDIVLRWIAMALSERGHRTWHRHRSNTWKTALPVRWADHVAAMSKPRRRRIRTLQQKAIDAGRVVRREVTNDAELERGLEILCDLHQRRRQSLGQQGCFSSQEFTNFHREVCRRFFALGLLRLTWTELDGQPVAVEYSLIGGRTIYCYQSGFRPDAAAQNPGWLQLIGSFRRAIDDGYEFFDFLRGDEPYKSSWLARPQPLTEFRISARHIGAIWRHRAWCAAAEIKRLVKPCPALVDDVLAADHPSADRDV